MFPSVKRIASRLNIDRETAQTIRHIMDGSVDPKSFDSVDSWLRQCYNMPNTVELRMCAINEVLGTHGVEALGEMTFPNGPHYSYCNTGDTYACTVMYDHHENEFLISDWGSIAETLLDE